MARLHEYQGKEILQRHGIATPRGGSAASRAEAEAIARTIGGRVIVKIQAFTTNRKALGGVAFANTPGEAGDHAQRMLGMQVGNFAVERVLIEEALPIRDELFVSFFVDDRERAPAMLLSLVGGSGIEERAKEHGAAAVARLACDVDTGPDLAAARALLRSSTIAAEYHEGIIGAVSSVFAAAKACEARSVEINPLVTVTSGAGARVYAADCRVTIDDYAVFRHPELGIEIARELDHPPTDLEKIAYRVEQDDHRGTFFFAQMNTAAGTGGAGGGGGAAGTGASGKRGLIGFHGAGGGGSMMSMDAITNEGFTIANFCDTSGNPSPAKVYRAARIILCQPGLIGYFGSGSGVANQEQFWSAYGLAKAFWELDLDIPVVIRLGGNTEDRAVEILESVAKGAGAIAARVEGYKKNDPPAKVARRFADLVADHVAKLPDAGTAGWQPRSPRRPDFVGAPASRAVSFPVKGGALWIDLRAWKTNAGAIIARAGGLLKDVAGAPALTVKPEELLMKDSDLIACEVECRRDGVEGVFVRLDIPGLEEWLAARR